LDDVIYTWKATEDSGTIRYQLRK